MAVIKKLELLWDKSDGKLRGRIILTFETEKPRTTPFFTSKQGLRTYLALHFQSSISNEEEFRKRVEEIVGMSMLQPRLSTEDALLLGDPRSDTEFTA